MAFIPIGDDNSDRLIRPWVNYLLIALNLLVFVQVQQFGSNHAAIGALATVPGEIVSGRDLATDDRVVEDPVSGQEFVMPGLRHTPVPVYATLLTAMFMHGGLLHLLGNLLYLWIFGDNLENALGHARYLAFYLVTGVLAGLAHVASTYLMGGDPLVPSLGASGAISGVLAGYVLLFPRRRVNMLMFRFVMAVPAAFAIGIWFVFQIVSGLMMIGQRGGGVAYGAHIGGFLAGLLLIRPMRPAKPPGRPKVPEQGRSW